MQDKVYPFPPAVLIENQLNGPNVEYFFETGVCKIQILELGKEQNHLSVALADKSGRRDA